MEKKLDLRQSLGKILVSDDEDGNEWTLSDFDDTLDNINDVISDWLLSFKKTPLTDKLKFGDTTPIDIAKRNALIDEILESRYE